MSQLGVPPPQPSSQASFSQAFESFAHCPLPSSPHWCQCKVLPGETSLMVQRWFETKPKNPKEITKKSKPGANERAHTPARTHSCAPAASRASVKLLSNERKRTPRSLFLTSHSVDDQSKQRTTGRPRRLQAESQGWVSSGQLCASTRLPTRPGHGGGQGPGEEGGRPRGWGRAKCAIEPSQGKDRDPAPREGPGEGTRASRGGVTVRPPALDDY